MIQESLTYPYISGSKTEHACSSIPHYFAAQNKTCPSECDTLKACLLRKMKSPCMYLQKHAISTLIFNLLSGGAVPLLIVAMSFVMLSTNSARQVFTCTLQFTYQLGISIHCCICIFNFVSLHLISREPNFPQYF